MNSVPSQASLRVADPPAGDVGLVVRVAGVVSTTTGTGGAATSAVTRVAVNVANVTLLAANANRKGATIENNSAASNLFLKLGATANIGAGTESFTAVLGAGVRAYYEVPAGYTGIIDGIWDAADAAGEALITELTV